MTGDKLTKLMSLIVAVVLVIYAVVSAYNSINNNVRTTTAYVTTVSDTADAQMFIIRDETILESRGSGFVVPLAENGGKVSSGSELAAVFSGEKAAENYAELDTLSKKLEIYKKIANRVDMENVDIEKLETDIETDFYSILDGTYNNDFSSLSDNELSFGEKLSRKRLYFGEETDCSAQIAELEGKIASLSSSSAKEIITADEAGYFVSRPDGFEDVLKVEDIQDLTKEKLEEAFKSEKKEIPDGTIGKMINGCNWYAATVVKSSEVTGLEVGKSVKLVLGDNDNATVSSKVYSKKILDDNYILYVFRCSFVNEELATLRKVTGKIVLGSHKGLKIPKDAVRFNDEGDEGVYILEGNVAKFNKIEEIYSSDNFVIAENKANSPGWLAQYDEIITSGKELSHGKIIG